jgi:hypothetical protein
VSNIISGLCAEVSLPKMIRARQLFDSQHIAPDAIPGAVKEALSAPRLGSYITTGSRIAITAGSRGVSNVALITRAIADFVKSKGAHPFVVPAMGSHGGATAEGQRALIESYGVTEEAVGCPILSSMETVVIGKSAEGHAVRMDKNAAEADGIIVAGRIKPHTDFHGPYESGLMKMMAIGLGKREGADVCHKDGFGRMAHMVPLFGKTILKNAPIALGFGILENAYSQTCAFAALLPSEIEAEEPTLLDEARTHLPLLAIKNTDVLVVERIGKNIAGTGMDPNVSGTGPCTPFIEEGGINALRTAVLDLTEETHGVAFGMGAAHVITRRLFNKIDYEATYVNAVTSRGVELVRIPFIVESDREAVQLALRTCIGNDPQKPRILRIADSFHTEHIWISEALRAEAEANPKLEILSGAEDWAFDSKGDLW